MTVARIKWLQRVLGRNEGDIEIVETDTDFMHALLAQGRYEILPDEDPEPAEVEQPEVPVVVAKPKPRKPAEGKGEPPSAAEELAEAQGVPAEDAKDAE